VIPDLAIEVVSRTNLATKVIANVGDYFRYGVRCVWVIYPVEELAYVYGSPTSVQILSREGILDSPAILPGFQLPLGELFEPESATP
jgi:Uma2 family endonuclease